jgi:hypothetical protein
MAVAGPPRVHREAGPGIVEFDHSREVPTKVMYCTTKKNRIDAPVKVGAELGLLPDEGLPVSLGQPRDPY